MGQDFTTILTGIGTIVLMLAVFVGAYYFSKFVSKKRENQGGQAFLGCHIWHCLCGSLCTEFHTVGQGTYRTESACGDPAGNRNVCHTPGLPL